jgi:AcrR family transcriptional regulator
MNNSLATETAEDLSAVGNRSLRERKKHETRVAIHEAAVRLVGENGVEGASVGAICSEAGVSNRTFFNYFPSKLTAVIGLSTLEVTNSQRAWFLEEAGEKNLMRDLCRLMKELTDSAVRLGPDRSELRELLVHRPELVQGVLGVMAELRHDLVGLAERRTDPERARLAIALLLSALACVMDAPLAPRVDDLDERLFSAISTIHAIAGESLAIA